MSAVLVQVDIPRALAEQAQLVEDAIDTLLPLPEGPERGLIDAMRYATLGGAAPQVRMQVGWYGRDLGAAFQIADDILDAVGTTEGIGKTAGKDEAAGKATLVSLMGLDRARTHAQMLARQAAKHLDIFG